VNDKILMLPCLVMLLVLVLILACIPSWCFSLYVSGLLFFYRNEYLVLHVQGIVKFSCMHHLVTKELHSCVIFNI